MQMIIRLTGTWDGNASSVICPILLMKFIAAILHSKESTRKWSRTSNVNRVWGFFSLAWMKCWMHLSNDLTQWHYRNELLKILVEDTMISFDWDWKFVPDSCVYVGSDWLTRLSISSNISMSNGLSTSTLSGTEEQLLGWWGRCIVSLPWRRSDFWKNCPFHIWTWWKGWFLWLETQQSSHQMFDPKQLLHRCVPGDCWQPTHVVINVIDSCQRSSIRMLCHWLTYSSRNLFWVCLVLFEWISFQKKFKNTFPKV